MVPSNRLNQNIASTHAVNSYLAISVDRASDRRDSEFFLGSIVKLCNLVVQFIEGGAAQIDAGNVVLKVDRHSRVIGFMEYLMVTAHHKTIQKALFDDPRLHKSDYPIIGPR